MARRFRLAIVCVSILFNFQFSIFNSAFAQKPIRIYGTYAEYRAETQLDSLLKLGGCKTTFGGKNPGHTIYVGLTDDVRRGRYKAIYDSLNNDGYAIIGDGKNVHLFGKGEKGTLYAVYAFLEQIGYRLYTPDAMVIPDLSNNLQPSTFNFRIIENPAFEWREVSYYYPNHSQLYADWHHLHTQADRDRLFGMYVHTFAKLIPPSRYFDNHSEWFSLNSGRRSRDGQLCLSNPEVLEELCKRLANTMAAFPKKKIWSVSPNDNYNACECDNCKRLDSLYGGQSGTLLWFVNQVATRFPDKTIATLAYQYTRKAPKITSSTSTTSKTSSTRTTITPAPNVLVMLCPIEAGRQAPITQTDPAFRKDIEEWSRLTDNLFVWDYVVQFRNFWNPFPNLHVLQPNLQYFRDNGTRMMFEQASGKDNITSWMDIRCYMIAKLLWNPDADIDSIMADFYQGYYSQAGRYVKEIVDTMTSALIESGQRLDIYGYPVDAAEGYLSAERMPKYDSIMLMAYHAVDGQTKLRSHLRYFQLALDFATVELQAYGHLPATRESITSRLDEMLATMGGPLGYDVPQMMEMGVDLREYHDVMTSFIDKNFSDRPHYPVTLRTQPTPPYSCSGAATLTDGQCGIMDYRHRWLGFWGDTLDAILDLGTEPIEINEISADFYHYPLSWIFLPDSVEYLVSTDGQEWESIVLIHPCTMGQEWFATPLIFTASDNKMHETIVARYVRIIAYPPPEIPAWHRAAGHKPWIFIDEIIVK